MHSTLNPKQTDPQRVLVARVDEELAHTYEQIAHADEQIARAEERLSKLEHDAPRYPSDHPQTRINTLRPAVLGNRPSRVGRAVRGFTALMLTACICVAAFVWQSSYGDAARQIIARWAPQLVSTSSLPLQNPGLPTQPNPPTARVVAAHDSISTSSTSGSDRIPRRRANSRPGVCRAGAVAPDDGARSRKCGARDRAAQGEPGTNGQRQCKGR